MTTNKNIVVRRYDNITKSAEDKRTYRGLELINGLRVLLVSDAETDKSAAAMDVNVGEFTKFSLSRCYLLF
jgi:insulysin